MSNISNLLSLYNKALRDSPDKIKGTISNTIYSRLAAGVQIIKEQSRNSFILGKGISSIFMSDPDLIKDEFMNGYISADDLSRPIAHVQNSSFDVDALIEYMNAVGYDLTIDYDGRHETIKAITLTDAAGLVYQIGYLPSLREEEIGSVFSIDTNGELDRELAIFFSDGKVSLSNVWYSITNVKRSVWDVMNEQNENAEYNKVLSDVANLVLNSSEELVDSPASSGSAFKSIASSSSEFLATFTSYLNELQSSAFSSVRSLATSLRSAWNENGVLAVVSYIVDTIKTATLLADDSGRLQFSSASTLTPAIYIAGVVTQIAASVAQVAGIVVTCFSRIAGAIITLIGSSVSAFASLVNYDYQTNTIASLVDVFQTGYPCFPHGFDAFTVQCDVESVDQWLVDLAERGVMMVCVPGGWYFLTYTKSVLSVEFHPDLVDRTSFFRINSLSEKVHPWNDSSSWITLGHTRVPVNHDAFLAALDDLEYQPGHVIANESNGVLSASSDKICRMVLLCNIAIHIYDRILLDSDLLYNLVSKGFISISGDYLSIKFSRPTNVTSIGSDLVDHYLCLYGESPSINSIDSEALPMLVYNDNFNQTTNSSLATDYGMTILRVLCLCTFYDFRYSYLASNDVISWKSFGQIASAFEFHRNLGEYSTLPKNLVKTAKSLPFGTKLWIGLAEKPLIIHLAPEYTYSARLEAPTKLRWSVKVPKYDRSSFWANFIVACVITVAVVATTVVVSVVAKKKINQHRALCAMDVETAWSQYLKDPTSSNYKAYRKACKKNNFFVKLFGGTQYSTQGLWADTDSSGGIGSVVGSQFESQSISSVNDTDLSVEIRDSIKGVNEV